MSLQSTMHKKEGSKGKHLSHNEKELVLQQYLSEGIKIKQILASNKISVRTLYNIVGIYKEKLFIEDYWKIKAIQKGVDRCSNKRYNCTIFAKEYPI